MQALIDLLQNFWKKPFNPDGDAANWLLFLGLIVIGLIMWKRVVDKIV